jgi:streptogramin lyase
MGSAEPRRDLASGARVDAFLPEGVENWTNTNQHGHTDRVGPHPLLADGIWSDGDDHGVDRAHGAVSGNQFVEVLLGVKDYVNLQAAQALAFDALDPATGTVTHYELGAGQSARLAGRGDTMAGYLIRGTFK